MSIIKGTKSLSLANDITEHTSQRAPQPHSATCEQATTRGNMVRESRKCLLEATFPVQSGTSSPLIVGLMKHDFGAEAARRERQQDVFNLPENLEAQ